MLNKENITINYLRKPVYSASLALFRIVFGLMILCSMIRFAAKGWITELYVTPSFYFKYYGFGWVQHWGQYTYLLFVICGLSALFFALGLFYRLASVVLFLSFTYIELLDKTNYLNHYYFVSLVLFLMMWLPAHANMALDNIRNKDTALRTIPLWTTGSIRLLLAIVYTYAGLAKLNSDWLVEAMPLRLWLPAKNDLPLIGPWFNKVAVAYVFSWFGALYDLTIPFFLLCRKTRPAAYATVIVFHILTAILFPIGMFPYVMIMSTLIFFPSAKADLVAHLIKRRWQKFPAATGNKHWQPAPLRQKVLLLLFGSFFIIQLFFPWRYLLYPGELFWTEEGYRFSWRVMLIEKMGYAQFIVRDAATGKQEGVNNNDFLTKNQEKMMSTQADFLLQYAYLLRDHYQHKGWQQPQVYATVYVTLNGRRSRLLIDPKCNLADEKDSFFPKSWLLPLKDEIHGL